MQTFHFEMLVRNEFVEIFQIYYWAVPSILFFTRKRLLRNCPCVGTTFWIVPFSTFLKLSVPLTKMNLLTFLSSLVFPAEMGDLEMGFLTPLQ